MDKDFDSWNSRKKVIDTLKDRPFFKEGDIWWLHLGLNIGYETNGKSTEYTRPVLILKKYNKYSFLAIPLSTSKTINQYRLSIGTIANKEATVNLSQLRNIDSKRLVKKIEYISKNKLSQIKEKAIEVNFQ